jgi:hypothetical protein
MTVTCEQLQKWLEKMPADAKVHFALDGQENTQEDLELVECFPQHGTYWIVLERKG